jgi:hypothetical protein
MVCRMENSRKWNGKPKLPLKGEDGLAGNML